MMKQSVSRLARSYRADEQPISHQERMVSVSAGAVGMEIRPTRLFLWIGSRGRGREWIYSLGVEPRLLRLPRRRRHVDMGGFHVSFLGNPALTLALFGARLARQLVARPA